MVKVLGFILSLLSGLLLFSAPVHGAVIFEDNFDLYLDGNLDSPKWQEYIQPPKCNAPWKIDNGKLGITINQSSCNAHIVPSISSWPESLSEYILDFDVKFTQGTDRHIDYRINTTIPFIHVMHFAIPGAGFSLDSSSPTYSENINKQYSFNTTYTFRLVVESQSLKVYQKNEDNDFELIKDLMHSAPIPDGTFGLGSNPGGGAGTTETWFDNVRVTTLDHEDSITISVPLLKQTSSPWNDDIYDSAQNWSSDDSFSRWGCAVTSAAMVFNYHGLSEMTDGLELDPGSLNEWLKSQSDGYVRNGLTNWLALTRLSRQISEQNGVDFDAFEFSKITSSNHQFVKDSIDSGNPDILREPGHFVVAKGYSDTGILINDPYHDRDDLSEYENTFENISRFTPSSTDLSYIMLVVDASVDVKVFDENNLEVETVVVIDDPITDPSGSSETSAQSLKTVYIKKPDSGQYRIEISGAGDYLLDAYLYDEDGKVKQLSFDGKIYRFETNTYDLVFDRDDSSNSEITEGSFNSLIKNINSFRASGDISNFGVYISLLSKANAAKVTSYINVKVSKNILNALQKELKAQKGKKISEDAYIVLTTDINKLIEQL